MQKERSRGGARGRTAGVVALAVASACRPSEPSADLILMGGRVYTVDPARPWAEAVAVRDGLIIYVGDDEGAEALADETTQRVSLEGRLVLPGFVDAHAHPLSGYELDLGGVTSVPAIYSRIAEHVRERPDEPWVEGYGWDLTLFPGRGPTREALDSLVPDRPAMIWGGDGHSLWVNSLALQAAGFDRNTPDPAGGRIERDAHGSPSGTLREAAATRMEEVAPAWSTERRVRALRRSLERMAQFGITAFMDAAVDDDTMLAAYLEAANRGMLTAHPAISLAVPRESEELDIDSLVTEFVRMRAAGDAPGLSVQAAKIFVDGVIEAGTAAMLEPYSGTSSRGDLLRPPEVLEPLVAALRAEGFQLHFHAIGDGAIRAVLDALDSTTGTGEAPPLIAHAQLVDPADVGRFAELGAVPVFSAVWAYEDSYIRDLTIPRLGPERSKWIYPIRTLNKAGATLAFGSDWPVTTMDPLQAIEVAVTRIDPAAEPDSSSAFLPDERLPVEAAIEAATLGSARALGRGDVSGSIVVGKRADLIVLSGNILEVPSGSIGDSRIQLTFFGGREVYRAGDSPITR